MICFSVSQPTISATWTPVRVSQNAIPAQAEQQDVDSRPPDPGSDAPVAAALFSFIHPGVTCRPMRTPDSTRIWISGTRSKAARHLIYAGRRKQIAGVSGRGTLPT